MVQNACLCPEGTFSKTKMPSQPYEFLAYHEQARWDYSSGICMDFVQPSCWLSALVFSGIVLKKLLSLFSWDFILPLLWQISHLMSFAFAHYNCPHENYYLTWGYLCLLCSNFPQHCHISTRLPHSSSCLLICILEESRCTCVPVIQMVDSD